MRAHEYLLGIRGYNAQPDVVPEDIDRAALGALRTSLPQHVLVVTRTFSKAYGLGALCIGWAHAGAPRLRGADCPDRCGTAPALGSQESR